jgi:hypothetical protein
MKIKTCSELIASEFELIYKYRNKSKFDQLHKKTVSYINIIYTLLNNLENDKCRYKVENELYKLTYTLVNIESEIEKRKEVN